MQRWKQTLTPATLPGINTNEHLNNRKQMSVNDQIIMYGATWCGDCRRAKRYFDEHNVAYTWVDIDNNAEAVRLVEKINNGNRSVPTIIFPDGDVLVEPSNAELERKLNPPTVMYGAPWCPDCTRAKFFFQAHDIPFEWVDIDENPEAVPLVEKINNGNRSIPTIIFPNGDVMVEPSNAELYERFKSHPRAEHDDYDVIIVGGGPAGLSAAVYTTREGLSTLILDADKPGGQINNTQWLDNYPGFEDGISGLDLAQKLTDHGTRFGAELLSGTPVTDIQRRADGRLNISTAHGDTYSAGAVLIATGTQYRHLNVPGEDTFMGKNIHFCATCDGAFYRDKDVLVVGGGNSGFEEGLFLTKFAKHVTIVEFMPAVKASQILQNEVAARDDMDVVVNHAVQEFVAGEDGKLASIRVQDRVTGDMHDWHFDGVFVFIGLSPNTGFLPESIETDQWGFVVADADLQTTLPGVFVAGDVRRDSTKQAVAAAGEGAIVALKLRQYLQRQAHAAEGVPVGD
jgi:thioredoxin reductase (NADPH)